MSNLLDSFVEKPIQRLHSVTLYYDGDMNVYASSENPDVFVRHITKLSSMLNHNEKLETFETKKCIYFIESYKIDKEKFWTHLTIACHKNE